MALPVVYATDEWTSYPGADFNVLPDTDAFPLPSGVQAGDLLVFIIHDHLGANQNWVPGYTRFLSVNGGEHQTELYWREATGTSADEINGAATVYGGSYRLMGCVLRITGWTEPPSASDDSIFAEGFTPTVLSTLFSIPSPGETVEEDTVVIAINTSGTLDWGDTIPLANAPYPPFSGLNYCNTDDEMWGVVGYFDMEEPDTVPGYDGATAGDEEYIFFGVTGAGDSPPPDEDQAEGELASGPSTLSGQASRVFGAVGGALSGASGLTGGVTRAIKMTGSLQASASHFTGTMEGATPAMRTASGTLISDQSGLSGAAARVHQADGGLLSDTSGLAARVRKPSPPPSDDGRFFNGSPLGLLVRR